jgi:P-type Cu+ transporter
MIDPVCGMDIDEQEAVGLSEFEGEKFYFCSSSCKEKFDQNPHVYAASDAARRR